MQEWYKSVQQMMTGWRNIWAAVHHCLHLRGQWDIRPAIAQPYFVM